MNELHYKVGAPQRHAVFQPLSDSKDEKWTAWYLGMKKKLEFHGGIYAFLGDRGTGKTQMAVSLCGHAIHNLGTRAYYVKASDMFDRLRMEDHYDYLAKLCNVDVLVIDAVEVRKDSDYEYRELNRIIDKRYDRIKSTTIMISNDTRGAFEAFIGPSVVSRMAETGGALEFTGKSFREDLNEQKK